MPWGGQPGLQSIIHHLYQEGISQRCCSQMLVPAFFTEVACGDAGLPNHRRVLGQNWQIPNLCNPFCRFRIPYPAQVRASTTEYCAVDQKIRF